MSAKHLISFPKVLRSLQSHFAEGGGSCSSDCCFDVVVVVVVVVVVIVVFHLNLRHEINED